jgi:phage replication O-like protein O
MTTNGYTQADNWLFDYVMPSAKPNTFKVVSAVCRMTAGWHRKTAELTFDDLAELTGISNRGTLSTAVTEALDRGYIKRKVVGRSFSYSLKIVPVDSPKIVLPDSLQSENRTGNQSKNRTEEQSENRTGDSPKIVPSSYYIKKEKERGKEKGKERIPLPPEKQALAEMVNALVDVTGMDGHRFWPELSNEAIELIEAGYLPDQLLGHYGRSNPNGHWNWYQHDWRGKKEEFPKPKHIWETISGAIKWQDDNKEQGGGDLIAAINAMPSKHEVYSE